jgi:hypothetical protein
MLFVGERATKKHIIAASNDSTGGAPWDIVMRALPDGGNWNTAGFDAVTIKPGTPTNTFVTTSAGNVGIGTASPTGRLTVDAGSTVGGGIGVTGTDSPGIGVGDGTGAISMGVATNSTAYATASTAGDGVFRSIGNLILANIGGGAIKFSTGPDGSSDTTKMIIQTGGNVGIGTNNPGQKLTVNGTIESTSGGIKFPDGTTQTTSGSGPWTKSAQSDVTQTTTSGTAVATDTLVSFTADGSTPYHITVTADIGGDYQGHVTNVSICLDGTTQLSPSRNRHIQNELGPNQSVSLSYVHTPGAGAHTYGICYYNEGGSTSLITYKRIFVMKLSNHN